ncbi:MAG: HAD-IB family hydrolase [Acidimicrobiia bacterium]
MSESPTVAVFDFDGTITRRDSLVPFVRRVAGPGRVAWATVRTGPALLAMAVGRADRDRTKAAFLARAIGGLDQAALERQAPAYAAGLVARRTRPEIVARVRAHQDAGHELVVISASPSVYVRCAAEELGIPTVLATELAVDDAGRVTGGFVGRNVRGQEKVRRLEEWIGARDVVVWAYGDSPGDRELLDRADVGVFVGRPHPVLPELPAHH